MSTSEARLAANRVNAKKSTGPQAKNGKAVACLNATQHGIFSARLLLDDEEPAEFQRLLADVVSTLNPVGAVELALAERIAITMWRQQAVIEEAEKLKEIDLKSLPRSAPLIFKQLNSDADEDGDDLEAHLKDYKDGLVEYVAQLVRWCREQLREAEKRPKIIAAAELVSAKRLLLSDETMELFTRYQTTLDNQFYKALRTYREIQGWRLKMLEGDLAVTGQAEEAAAA